MPKVLPLRVTVTDLSPDSGPILVNARQAAALLGVGLRTIRTMDAAGKMPAPVRLSRGCVRWRLTELILWTNAGCPSRTTWTAICSTHNP